MSQTELAARTTDADGVVSHIQSGDQIFVHGASATPAPLLQALARRTDLRGVRLYHLHLAGELPFDERALKERMCSHSFFTGPNLRQPIADGRAEFIPIFLSDIPHLFLSGQVRLQAALVQLSPPDRHGLCTLGTSCDIARAAVDSARLILAEINAQMPRTHGPTTVHTGQLHAAVVTDRPLFAHEACAVGTAEQRIGEHIAALVEDGATLQLGIGAIPDAVLAQLGNKHDLGVHSEMFSDGLIPLIEGGVVTNRYKAVHAGRSVTSFVTGSRRLFDFVHDNQRVEFHGCDRTNDTALIRKNPKVTAINSALEIDLTGQVCADSIGHKIFSGIGGQMDFIRGAALSPGGKAIIALPSTAAKGSLSRIVPALKEGAGVVTTRGHVHWVVTEFGAVNLHGLSLRQRADALIHIAHPDFQSDLRQQVARLRHF